jgi:predicted esterase
MSGKTAGIFSVLFTDSRHGVIVGGDYTKEREVGDNSAWTNDGGKTWRLAGKERPKGYRSGVARAPVGKRPSLIAVGPSGSDVSSDGGKSWRSLGEEGFHSLGFAQNAEAGWAVGENGRIAKYKGQSVVMKNGLLSLLAGGLASFNQRGQSKTSGAQIERRRLLVNGQEHHFQVFVPAKLKGQENLPVIVFLHGIGQRGTDGFVPTEGAAAALVRHYLEQVPAIILMPQCVPGSYWSDALMSQMVMQSLEETIREFKADAARVYLTGVSMGGYGVWHLASEHPGRFAALVPICGGSSLKNGDRFSPIAQKIGRTPAWVFHGADDRVVPVSESREMVKALRAGGSPVRYSEYAGVGHNVWMKVLGEKDLLPWLLEQKP